MDINIWYQVFSVLHGLKTMQPHDVMLTLVISVEDFPFYNSNPGIQGLPDAHPTSALLKPTLRVPCKLMQSIRHNHVVLGMCRRLERVHSSSNHLEYHDHKRKNHIFGQLRTTQSSVLVKSKLTRF